MTASYPRIPYGEADIRRIRLRNWLYVDKTRFIRRLEDESYAFLIRPRRFGKSLWVSVLRHYYDRSMAEHWHGVFDGTDIGRAPTEDHSRYVVLGFDFSAFNNTLETLEERFETYCGIKLRGMLERNDDLFPDDILRRILAPASIDGKLQALFEYAGDHDIPLYVMIDEYDNFANTILAHRGAEAYESFTHGGGFYRSFFATLKAGAGQGGGGIERLFITGVSPVTMDDVTSGFNIGTNISLEPDFNEMLGFTSDEVRGLVELYRDAGAFSQDPDEAMAVMGEWYSGYRFAEEAKTDIYNTDMVLYYLKRSIPNRGVPRELIDMNIRIDYGKLRHLLVTGQRLNGNFDLLREVAANGEAQTRVAPGFPLERLHERENFLSLMHFFGLLSIRSTRDGMPVLGIPNQSVGRLMYGYLRDAWREMGVFALDFYVLERLIRRMAYHGEWRALIDHVAEALARQTGIRDYIDGERTVQGFLAAYLGLTEHFALRSESELGKGFADLHLEPVTGRPDDPRHGFVIELKYLKRSEAADDAVVQERLETAKEQLRRYLTDEGLRPSVRHVGLALVFHGWELVASEAVEPDGQLR